MRYTILETCRMGVWYVCEDGSECPVAGPFMNEYWAQTECDKLNGEG